MSWSMANCFKVFEIGVGHGELVRVLQFACLEGMALDFECVVWDSSRIVVQRPDGNSRFVETASVN